MDRDQRSRRQKSSAVPPPRKPAHRGMKSRLGLTKKGAPPERPAPQRPAAPRGNPSPRPAPNSRLRPPAGQPRTGKAPTGQPRAAAPAGKPPHRAPAQQNPQKGGYRAGGRTRPPRRVTQAELLRRRRRRALLSMLLVVVVLIAGGVLSVNLLFKVSNFRIENADGSTPADTGVYSEQQILDLLAIQEGDNLFGFSPREKSDFLLANLPYLDVADVAIQMPNTVVVKVQPATERFTMEYGSQWLVLSDALKVLRTDGTRPEGLILLEAQVADGQSTTPGSFLALLSEGSAQVSTAEDAYNNAQTVLEEMMQQLDENGLLAATTSLSLADMSELNFLYDGRVLVQLGTANDLDYKIKFAANVILDVAGSGLSATDQGTMDVSHQYSDGTPYLTFQAATPTPAPTAAPEGETTDGADADGTDPQAQPTPTPAPQES